MFYISSLYQEAFATLLYGIKSKKGFIVITGEVGTGKTTLLRKLMRNLDLAIRSVFIFNTYFTGSSGFTVKEYSPQRHRVRRGFVQDDILIRFSPRPQCLRGVISESSFTTNWNSVGAVTHTEA